MTREQILELAARSDDYADQYLQSIGEYHPDWHSVRDEHFYHAAIQQYKDSLLKDVGEPVAYATTNEEGDLSMLFFDEDEARKYSGDDEPIKLIVKPGE